jgi:hypothetical protein
VASELSDLEGLLERAGVPAGEVTAADAASLRDCLPEIMDAVGRLLRRVRAGELALPPDGRTDGTAPRQRGHPAAGVRAGWL